MQPISEYSEKYFEKELMKYVTCWNNTVRCVNLTIEQNEMWWVWPTGGYSKRYFWESLMRYMTCLNNSVRYVIPIFDWEIWNTDIINIWWVQPTSEYSEKCFQRALIPHTLQMGLTQPRYPGEQMYTSLFSVGCVNLTFEQELYNYWHKQQMIDTTI